MALNLAVDRKAIVDSVFKGRSRDPGGVPMFPKIWWPADVRPYPFDPARAKNLLAEGRLSQWVEMTLKLHVPGREPGKVPSTGGRCRDVGEAPGDQGQTGSWSDFGVLRPLLAAREITVGLHGGCDPLG